MIAPAYTMIWITATNGASSRTYKPASPMNDPISRSTLWTGFDCTTTSSVVPTAMAAKT